ncbi:2,3-diaminopropionate biosynthesis protein SbnB [Cohnella lubricantis]|uniref:2,3-diaminopropionate biosynthesis protein SbnB n=1 Tax=Cohnella lubricantis TaxID=2163172 RepID=A0A841THT3_9BACL|nr:2,3-diaminopropionate biosynthesis protein SbnB [Cohnella lubricantis]MBB6679459.1 2,3-diaminopropionate biosynthesis protein SbnB [Cohnella lubricantis]MBP2118196.1 ornithine cyclodeaminase [Cohnella lubricantis]
MRYLNDGHIRQMGTDWRRLTAVIREAAALYGTEEAVQPLKPYLRFRDPANRLIAMPAYVGSGVDACGVKWVASYPGNLARGLPRAHSVIALNDPSTGEPVAIYSGGLLNALRTAAVSGTMLEAYLKRREEAELPSRFSAGIAGFGPIGRTHLAMLAGLFGSRLEEASVFDPRGASAADIDDGIRSRARIASDWRVAYAEADVFITCTTAAQRYIDRPPRPGMLLLNVSLRDYKPHCVKDLKAVVVDDWREVCRENTDIEQLQQLYGWNEARTVTLKEALLEDGLNRWPAGETVFFNPMGLAVFDIAVAAYYWRTALREGIGVEL